MDIIDIRYICCSQHLTIKASYVHSYIIHTSCHDDIHSDVVHYYMHEFFILIFLSDGSGEDDILSPIGSATDLHGLRSPNQFPEQRGPSDRSSVQPDLDYTSSTTLWSNSSR